MGRTMVTLGCGERLFSCDPGGQCQLEMVWAANHPGPGPRGGRGEKVKIDVDYEGVTNYNYRWKGEGSIWWIVSGGF